MKLKVKTKKNSKENLEENNYLKNKNFLNSQNYILGKNETKKLFSKFFIENLSIKILKIINKINELISNNTLGIIILIFLGIFINFKIFFSYTINFIIFSLILISIKYKEKIEDNNKNILSLKKYFFGGNTYVSFIIVKFIFSFIIAFYLYTYVLERIDNFNNFIMVFSSFFIGAMTIFVYYLNIFNLLLFPFFLIIIFFVAIYSLIKSFIFGGAKKYKFIKFSPQTKFLEKFEEITPYLAYNKYYKIIKKLF